MVFKKVAISHASARIQQCKLSGKIDWQLDDFLSWVSLQADFARKLSNPFELSFPDVNKQYYFRLGLTPKGYKNEQTTKSFVGLYLFNDNSEDLTIRCKLSIVDKTGSDLKSFSFEKSFSSMTGRGTVCFIPMAAILTNPDKFLENGSFRIRCDFTFYSDLVQTTTQNKDSNKLLKHSMMRLMKDSKFSDFQILCEGQVFPCHRSVLANQSDVLENMMSGNWSENSAHVLKIDDFDSSTVESMLHYIYTNQLSDKTQCLLSLLVIADKYNIADLVRLCEKKVGKALKAENALNILVISDRIGAKHLRSKSMAFVAKNLPSLQQTSEWNEIIEKDTQLKTLLISSNQGINSKTQAFKSFVRNMFK